MITKETEYALYRYEKPILYILPKKGTVADKIAVELMLRTAVEITGRKKYCSLVEGSYPQLTVEAKEFLANNKYNKYRYASAYVVSSLAHKLAINFFIKFLKPSVPSRMFTNVADAKAWLESIYSKEESAEKLISIKP